MIVFRRVVANAIAFMAGAGYSLAAMALGPAYAPNATSVFVPFANATSLPLTESPRLSVGFPNNAGSNSGTPFSVTMDTGSTGIYVGRDYFTPPANGTSDTSYVGSCTETLTSSGVIFNGALYRVPVNLYNANTVVAISTVPVCAVNAVSCTPNARVCNPSQAPNGVVYFGVGFGQEQSGQPNGTPDKNPFLNITSAGALSPLPSYGYILTTQQGQPGAMIGLTPGNTQYFALIALSPYPQYAPTNAASPFITSEFKKAQGVITADGTSGYGSVLFDTGVSTGFLTPPAGVSVATGPGPANAECTGAQTCADAGTRVQVSFSEQASSANPNPPVSAAFSYTVGDSSNPVSPYAVTIVNSSEPFLNTTLSFLNAFNYFYDGANGLIGLQASSAPMTTLNADCVFNWAQGTYPTLFAPAGALSQTLTPYYFRYYAGINAYLGASSADNKLYYLGPATANTLLDAGPLAYWRTTAGCQ